MKSEPEKLLGQLVVTALTGFMLILLLLAALILRQLWLQHQIVELSNDLQENLAELEEITVQIEDELLEITPDGAADRLQERDEIAEAIDDVSEQMQLIEEDLEEVAEALEPGEEGTSTSAASAEQEAVMEGGDQVDQVFTIFTVLIALTSILVALLLIRATRVGRREWGAK